MPQFGAGLDVAAQCPQVPAPDGWRAWTNADGPVPDALASRANSLASDQSVPLGTTESYPLPGVVVLIRLEPQVWGKDAKGAVVQGCFRTAALWLPSQSAPGTAVAPPTDSTGKVITVLTIASLAVGTAATIATWGKK